MRLHALLPGLTLAVGLVAATAGARAQVRAVDAVGPPAVRQLDVWSRTQVVLARQPVAGCLPSAARATLNDFQAALQRNRPWAVAHVGGVEVYAEQMHLYEAQTFKGFLFEHSVVRRHNARILATYLKLGDRGHPFIDAFEIDRATAKTVRTYQIYAGSKPRAALRKFLFSDREADRFIVPRDVFQRIRQAVHEAETLWASAQAGKLDAQVAARQIRERVKKVGLKYDAGTRAVFVDDPRLGGAVLGHVGSDQLHKQVQRLVGDWFTSEQIRQKEIVAQLGFRPQWRLVLRALGDEQTAVKLLAGKPLGHVSNQVEAELSRGVLRATLNGVSTEIIQGAVRESFQESGTLEDFARRAGARLSRLADEVQRKQLAQGGAILAAFTMAGAAVDFYASDKDIEAWIESGKGAEWAARGASGGLALLVAHALERQAAEQATATTGGKLAEKELAGSGLKLVRGRFLRVGVASAVFMIGESAFAAFRGESGPEIAGRMYEAALVLSLAEGAVFATEYLFAASLGSWAGPVGIGVTIGVTGLYEGVKYLWTTRTNLAGTLRVFTTKCDLARSKLQSLQERTLESIAGNLTR